MLNIMKFEVKAENTLVIGKALSADEGYARTAQALVKHAAVTDGLLTKLTRRAITLAFEKRENAYLTEHLAFVKPLGDFGLPKAVEHCYEQCGFEKNTRGLWSVKDYSAKAKVTRMLSAKTYGVLNEYAEYKRVEKLQRKLERQNTPQLKDEVFTKGEGAMKLVENELTEFADKLGRDLKNAQGMPTGTEEQKKVRQEYLAYLDRAKRVTASIRALVGRLNGLPADEFDRLIASLNELNR